MSVLAWFELPDETAVERFKVVVTSKKYGALFEGWGTDARTQSIEGFAVFPNKTKLEACARDISKKMQWYLIDHVL